MAYFKIGNTQFADHVKDMSKDEFFEAFKNSKLNLENTWKHIEKLKPKKKETPKRKRKQDEG